jgi:flagellar biosynthesis protein FlhA
VVDASTVVATHINQLLLNHTHELLGLDEVQQMLEKLAKHAPKLAEELPNSVPLHLLLVVLKNLLMEGVPIRDLRTIAEALASQVGRSQDPVVLTAAARIALKRIIVQSVFGAAKLLPVITLEPAMEQLLLKSLQQAEQAGNGDDIVLEPGLAEKLQQALVRAAEQQELAGKPAVLLVSAPLRNMMARFARYSAADLQVLSYAEIPADKQVTIESTVG